MLSQKTLCLTLRQADRKAITARQTAEPDVRDLTAPIVDSDPAQLVTGPEHRIDHSHHLKYFERARKDSQRSRGGSWGGRFVDDSAPHASPGQFASHGQSD